MTLAMNPELRGQRVGLPSPCPSRDTSCCPQLRLRTSGPSPLPGVSCGSESSGWHRAWPDPNAPWCLSHALFGIGDPHPQGWGHGWHPPGLCHPRWACAAAGPRRDGAEKCSCYNVLLFRVVGSSVRFKMFILFRYRMTQTDRDVFGTR